MQGQIYTWSLLGYGFVLVNGKDLFFLHHSGIKQGADLIAVKQPVQFDVAAPLPGKRYSRAINAVIGHVSEARS